MRNDVSLTRRTFLGATEWTTNPESGAQDAALNSRARDGSVMVNGKLKVHSLSGHERNHLFLNRSQGAEFIDISGVSALDDEADSRSFALLDYDRDGWQDVALINAGNPLARLYRNELGRQGRSGNVIALRFEGGNHTPRPSKLSTRDGYGARVALRRGQEILRREHRCGEGFAAQNSATMLIGIGDWPNVEEMIVRWPSGKQSRLGPVKAGKLVSFHEEGGEKVEPYAASVPHFDLLKAHRSRFPIRHQPEPGTRLIVWKVMASWCPACRSHLPQIALLADKLREEGVAFVGIPSDPSENTQTLGKYVEEEKPAYRLLTELSDSERETVSEFFRAALQTEELALPMSAITIPSGEVFWTGFGLPTVSDVRKLLAELP